MTAREPDASQPGSVDGINDVSDVNDGNDVSDVNGVNLGGRGVLHVVVAGDVGGAERVVLELVRASANEPTRRPHAVALITPNPALRAFFRHPDIPVLVGPGFREGPAGYVRLTFGSARATWLAQAARTAGAGLLHLHTFASHVLGARVAARLKRPFVRTEHSRRVYDDWSCWPLSRWSLARADAVVAISHHICELVHARAPFVRDRLTVVFNGVALPRTPLAPPPPERFMRFAIAARLEPRKGVDLGLEALALMPEAQLTIAGDGPERPRLEALARRLHVSHRVTFLGWQTEATRVLAEADAVLVPSRTEGLSLVALEAMAVGRAVVARPIGPLPELVRPDQTGFLASDTSVEALAQAMRKAAADRGLTHRLGLMAHDFVRARFTRAAMARGYEAVYARLVT